MKYTQAFKKELKKLVEEISEYEEGDTGDTPGYFVDEDLDEYVMEIIKLFEKYA